MKKFLSLLSLILFYGQLSLAQVTWHVDPAHSYVHFSINHLGISMVDGQFRKLEGTVLSKTDQEFNESTINFTIDVNSIDTRVEARDKHLKSEDFFAAEKFPQISFKNAVLKRTEQGKYQLEGDLTMKDVTKKVQFDVIQNNGIIQDPWGKMRAGFTAKLTLNRFDYHISYDDKLPSGVPSVASEVNITVNVEVVKQE